MSEQQKKSINAVYLQTLIVAMIGAALSVGAQFAFPPLSKAVGLAYDPLRYILGGVYGWLIGVMNFLGMGLSLILVTSSIKDRQEGQKKGQILFTVRLVAVLVLTVIGCLVPIFHPLPVLVCLALTQLGIMLYALIFKGAAGKKAAKAPETAEQDASSEEETGPAPDSSPETRKEPEERPEPSKETPSETTEQ